jgi:peptidoglycan lytic transglycosylase
MSDHSPSADPRDRPVRSPPASSTPPRRRRPWLLYALAGAAVARIFGADAPRDSRASGNEAPRAAKPSVGSVSRVDLDGPITASTLASSLPWVNLKPATSSSAAARPAAEPLPVLGDLLISKKDATPGSSAGSAPFVLTARPVAPGRTWQDAANAADWPAVALLIDGLPAAEQSQPGARYARAMAAKELGQCQVALHALEGLESELGLLTTEIGSLRAHCQLEVGPFDAAYEYFNETQSAESLTLAARAAVQMGDLAKAEQTIERALSRVRRQAEGKRAQQKEIAARALRAEILEARGQPKVAARDWLWLATETPTAALGASADDTYERLAEAKLGSRQRLERMRAFAREGQLDRTLREYARLASAPGPAAERVDLASALAWAYYHSRSDYLKAAELFREAAELSADTRVKFSFYAARALSRANEDDRAIEAYQELLRRYPGSAYAEQIYYRIARCEYGRGHWESAERAYTDYLDRYARNGGGQYASASRYELAISRLGAKQRTDEAALTLGQMARKERHPDRRAMLSHLEAVALETTREPQKVAAAVAEYRAIIMDRPLSFAAMASAARLTALGNPEGRKWPGLRPSLSLGGTDEPMRLPDKARFLADIGLHSDAERALFDEGQVGLAPSKASDGQALCQMYGALDRGYRSYAVATRLLRKNDDLGALPSGDNLWAWRCAYPQPYRDIVSAVESHYHLPPSLVHAVMRQESAFRPNVVSPVGAIGLMQLMPTTARRAAEEIAQQPGAPWVPDPSQTTNVTNNVELGGFYLSKLLGMLNGQLPVVVAAYNAGPSAVSAWLAGGEDLPIDVWVARIPYTETRDYVSFVVGNWLAYRYLSDPTDMPELKLAMIPGTRAAPDAY